MRAMSSVSSTRWGTSSRDPAPTVFERLAHLLERTPVLAHRAENRRVHRALTLQRLGATWRCPAGHLQPQDFREVKAIVIGLIGPTATTKSSYLGSLLYQLTNHAILNDMGLRFTIQDEPSRRRWEQLYEGQLRSKRAPGTTLRPGREEQTPPLVVRMTVHPPAGRDGRYDLVFFDSAGEVQQTGHDVAVHSPFVQLMHAALLFYTPKALQFPRDVYRLPAEEQSQTAPGPSRVVGTFTTLQAQLSQHPAYVGRHPTRDLPVAAVLSKADELTELVDREFGGGGFPSLPLDGSYFLNPLRAPGAAGPAAVRDHPPLRRRGHPAGHRTALPAADLPRRLGHGLRAQRARRVPRLPSAERGRTAARRAARTAQDRPTGDPCLSPSAASRSCSAGPPTLCSAVTVSVRSSRPRAGRCPPGDRDAGLGLRARFLDQGSATMISDGSPPPRCLAYELTEAGTLLISKAYAAGASRPGQYVVHALLDPTGTLRPRDLFGCAESGLLLAEQPAGEADPTGRRCWCRGSRPEPRPAWTAPSRPRWRCCCAVWPSDGR